MKITVTIYNDDEAANRDIQVLELSIGKDPKRTIIQPGERSNMQQFKILGGDILIVAATGS